MSAATTSSSPAAPIRLSYEAFGQTGIRQYIGSTIAFLCAAMMALSIALWYRSHDTADILDIYHPYGRVIFSSTWGRLLVAGFPTQGETEWTWYYNSRPFRPPGNDRWQASIWKYIGVEMRLRSPDPTRFTSGWWIRIKWSTATVLLGIWPFVHALRQTRMRGELRRARRESATVARYCGRCGRPLSNDATRCTHCGREFQ